MRQGVLQIGLLILGIGVTASSQAQDNARESLFPAFKIQQNDFLLNPDLASHLSGEEDGPYKSRSGVNGSPRSYDAIFYYPLHRRGVTIDLGVNIRFQEELGNSDPANSQQRDWLDINTTETQTRLHAGAVFDLPFDGLKAGVSGSYQPSIENLDYDYQAKLSYKWKNGFGLEGGWQHQLKSLDQQSLNEQLDVQSLFLDLNYRF